MTDETIEPALTPEEWSDRLDLDQTGLHCYGPGTWFEFPINEVPKDHHVIASLALHEQEFGFTWDDVYLLQAVVTDMSRSRPIEREDDQLGTIYDLESKNWQARLNDLADRIAALLPPREDA